MRRMTSGLLATSVVSLALVPSNLLQSSRSRGSLSSVACAASSSSTTYSSSRRHQSPADISFINSSMAKQIDAELMDPSRGGFSLDQLMELAGLSVATAADDLLKGTLRSDGISSSLSTDGSSSSSSSSSSKKKVLLMCGPGNNGGDGLVAARHLFHLGYAPEILYPKKSSGRIFDGLVRQCENLQIPVRTDMEGLSHPLSSYDLVIDGLFGFSFTGEPREPFLTLLRTLGDMKGTPILSIDIPSGWEVDSPPYSSAIAVSPSGESGAVPLPLTQSPVYFTPLAVISLTAPKLCMQNFPGIHYVGGRFVPPKMEEELGLRLVKYEGTDQIAKLSSGAGAGAGAGAGLSLAESGGAHGGKIVLSLVTAPNKEEADKIAQAIVSSGLAACVNILPGITSVYSWQGKIESGQEVMMVIKSRSDKESIQRLTMKIKELHSYETPEVIQVNVTGGLEKYIQWVLDSTTAAP